MSEPIFYHDIEQGSPEWFAIRAGIPTASMFQTLLREGKEKGTASKTRATYMHKLAGERITGEPMESYSNDHMLRGREMEAKARQLYALISPDPLTRIGFAKDEELGAGASPDALVGDNSVLEIKTALPHVLVAHILKGEFPSEHYAQTQGNLLVAQRDKVVLEIFWPSMRPFIKEVGRDEPYIATLRSEIDRFNDELAEIVARVSRYGEPSTLGADLRASLQAAV